MRVTTLCVKGYILHTRNRECVSIIFHMSTLCIKADVNVLISVKVTNSIYDSSLSVHHLYTTTKLNMDALDDRQN